MWTYWLVSGASVLVMAAAGAVIGKAVHRAKGDKHGIS